MIINTEAIVLKRFSYSDTSMIARCFTQEHGKISIMVRGAKRKKNNHTSFLQPINHLDLIYHFKSKRDIQTASKMSYHKLWSKFQNNLKHISYGLALMEITDKAITSHDPHPELFSELVSVLHKMDSQEHRLNIIFWYYEMKMLTLLGFKPDLNGNDFINNGYINPRGSPNSLNILKSLQTHSLESMPNLTVSVEDRKTVGGYLSGNLRYHFDFNGPLHSFNFMRKLKF